MSTVEPTSYDVVPYVSHAFHHTHPDRLASIARLFGLQPPPVQSARVLELGCASGGNLLPMAAALPGAEFLGIDLSERQIEEGRAIAEQCGASNIRLEHRDILDIGADDGLFDYVICHGVYSWVPPHVQAKILAICEHNMVPSGVAYVSYNTFPGWHLRASVREMMRFHAARFEDPQERVDQARALLRFLGHAAEGRDDAFSHLLQAEIGILAKRHDSYLFHEHLEEHNEPLYFYEFVERAKTAGLRYLGEANTQAMFTRDLPDDVVAKLNELAGDVIHIEQYLDFLRNGMFRRSLLCHSEAMPDRTLDADQLRGLHAAARVTPPADLDVEAVGPVEFALAELGTAVVDSPVEKLVLLRLHQEWPRYVPVSELYAAAAPFAESAAEAAQQVASVLLSFFSAGGLELHHAPHRFAPEPGSRPRTTSVIRHQASAGLPLVTLRHEMTNLDDFTRQLLAQLDGSRDVEQLVDWFVERALAGEIHLSRGEDVIRDEAELRTVLGSGVRDGLQRLARDAFLVA